MKGKKLRTELGRYILSARMEKNMAQYELAEKLGFSAQFMGVIESGRVMIPEKALKRAIEILDLDLKMIKNIYIYATLEAIDEIIERIAPPEALAGQKNLSLVSDQKV